MLYLYTENFSLATRLKIAVKILVGRQWRGPQSVVESLRKGLYELQVPYVLDRAIARPIETACVITGAGALKKIIKYKESGLIKKIIAGPVVGLPKDNNGLIFHPAIDVFLTPSSWPRDFCDSFRPGFAKKTKVWAAGVETLPESALSGSRELGIIYKKNCPEILYNYITEKLKSRRIPYKVIEYGAYNRKDYLNYLTRAKFMIFLSASESQGIALNEAWMCNVPTLAWNGGFLRTPEYEWKQSSPAPYLTSECGMFFQGEEDFPSRFKVFFDSLKDFHARSYHLNNFTNAIAARNFLKIVEEI